MIPAPAVYAVTCRGYKVGRQSRFVAWAYPMVVGRALPALPMYLTDDLAISVDLEATLKTREEHLNDQTWVGSRCQELGWHDLVAQAEPPAKPTPSAKRGCWIRIWVDRNKPKHVAGGGRWSVGIVAIG